MARIIRRTRTGQTSTVAVNGRKVAALIAHGASFYTTYLFITSLNGENTVSLVIALALELVLHIGKKLFISHGERDVVGISCLGIDTLFNAGGLYPTVLKLGNTSTWQMLAAASSTEATVQMLPGVIIALALGGLLSVAPVLLWKGK